MDVYNGMADERTIGWRQPPEQCCSSGNQARIWRLAASAAEVFLSLTDRSRFQQQLNYFRQQNCRLPPTELMIIDARVLWP